MRSIAFVLLAVTLAPGAAQSRGLSIAPANPTALEFVQVTVDVIASCEDVRFRGFGAGDGNQGTITLFVDRFAGGVQCDDGDRFTLTLGAFPPGTYRLQTVVGNTVSPPVVDGQLDFVVTPGTTTAIPRDRPQEDLSGVWVTAAEPFTGFTFINSGAFVQFPDGVGRANRVTGLWYDYSGGTPTWTTLLLDSVNNPDIYSGQVTRAVPAGVGPERTVTFTAVGTATLRRNGTGWRIDGSIDGRTFNFPLERFRHTRVAWPALAPFLP